MQNSKQEITNHISESNNRFITHFLVTFFLLFVYVKIIMEERDDYLEVKLSVISY